MLTPEEIESLRRSHAAAGLTRENVDELLKACQQMTRERTAIKAVLADLGDSFAAVRTALNKLHRIVQ